MDNEKKLSNIKINEVLSMLEGLDSQVQSHDDAELSEQSLRGNSFHIEDTQRRVAIQELSADGFNKVNGAAEPNNWKMKSEEENEVNQTKSKALEKIKVHPSNKSSLFQLLIDGANNKVNNDFEAQYFKDARRSENKGKVRPSL